MGETSKKMDDLLAQFESGKDKPRADIDIYGDFLGGAESAGTPPKEVAHTESLPSQKIIEDYPTFEDRELLAGALEQKYLRGGSKFDEEFDREYERGQKAFGGHSKEFLKMRDKRTNAERAVPFITEFNNVQFDKEAKQAEEEQRKQEGAAASERFRQTLAEEKARETEIAIKKFSEQEVVFPPKKDGTVRKMTLPEYAEWIAEQQRLQAKEPIPDRAKIIKTSWGHFKSNLDFALTPRERGHLYSHYYEDFEKIQKHFQELSDAKLYRELTDEEKEELHKVGKQLQKDYGVLRLIESAV